MSQDVDFQEFVITLRKAVFRSSVPELEKLDLQLESMSDPRAAIWRTVIQAHILRRHQHLEEAIAMMREAESRFREISDWTGVCSGLLGVAVVLFGRMQFSKALEAQTKALEIATTHDLTLLFPAIHHGMARALHQMGQLEEAAAKYEQAIDGFRQIQDDQGLGVSEATYGALLAGPLSRGAQSNENFNRGTSLIEQAAERLHALGDIVNEGLAIGNHGILLAGRSEYEEALRYTHRALALYQEIEHSHHVSFEVGALLGAIGQIHFTARNLDTAKKYLDRAAEYLIENPLSQPAIYTSLGILNVWSGDAEEALRNYRKAQVAIEALEREDTAELSHLHVNIAHAEVLLGRLEDAEQSLQTAQTHRIGNDNTRAWLGIIQGKLQLAKGDPDAAAETIASIDELLHRDTMKWEHIEAVIVMRDIAMAKNDLQGYVKHNDLVTTLTEELRGSKTQQSLALIEQEKEVEAERQRTQQEREKERAVLYSALPKAVADRVVAGETVNNDQHDNAAVIFLDIAGFTKLSSTVPPGHVVHLLDAIFNACDEVVERHDVTKIKTIGDSYMAVAFPEDGHPPAAERAAAAALDLLDAMDSLEVTMPEDLGDTSWIDDIPRIDVRIGIHIGPVVAGVIGSKRLQYDVWGDTVNTASRMESTGEPGKIQCSEAFVGSLTSLRDDARHPEERSDEGPLFNIRERGTVDVKGKGTMKTYWLAAE